MVKTLSSASVKKLRLGFSTLDHLWKKGLFPKDLKRHYTLYWFVTYDGNIIKTAAALQIHRNTIQAHFPQLGFGGRAIRLRHSWQRLGRKSSGAFNNRFYTFYSRFSSRPKLTRPESTALTGLWQTGFPYKILIHHYLLWGLRSKKNKLWLQSRLGYSYRQLVRMLGQILKAKAKQAFWLSPLKPKYTEIYSPQYYKLRHTFPRKNRKRL